MTVHIRDNRTHIEVRHDIVQNKKNEPLLNEVEPEKDIPDNFLSECYECHECDEGAEFSNEKTDIQ